MLWWGLEYSSVHKVFSCKHEDLILDFWHPHKKLDSAVAQMCHPCMGEVETGTSTGFPGQPAQAHQQTPGPSVTSRLKTSGGQSLRNNIQFCPLASPTTLPCPPTHPHMDSNTKKKSSPRHHQQTEERIPSESRCWNDDFTGNRDGVVGDSQAAVSQSPIPG